MSAPPVFDLGRPWLDDRQLAVCHASSPGEQAWAVLGGTTFFLAGLLRCLQGEAAVLHGGSGPTEPAPPWQVTVASLVRTLPSTVQRLTEKQLPSEQRVFVKAIMSREVVLYRLDSAPLVTVTVEFEPAEVAPRAAFEIRKGDGSLVEIAEGSRASDRRELILPAGFYAVRVSFLPAAGATEPAEKDVNFFSQLLPPQAIWRVEVPS
jgi:hypothetical protein